MLVHIEGFHLYIVNGQFPIIKMLLTSVYNGQPFDDLLSLQRCQQSLSHMRNQRARSWRENPGTPNETS